MENVNLKKIFKKPQRKVVSAPAPLAMVNAYRDWMIIVIVFAVGLISLSGLAWQIYLSDHIGGGYLQPTVSTTDMTVKTLDEKRLNTNLTILNTHKADFIYLKSNPLKLIDPSR